MTVVVLAAILLSSALCLPAWWFSRRRDYFYAWEAMLPSVPVLLWILLTYLGIGPQSLGNIVELPVAVIFFTACVYLKSFALKGWGVPKRTAAWCLTVLAVLLPLALRYSFPLLPE
jgi:hypothetical protein